MKIQIKISDGVISDKHIEGFSEYGIADGIYYLASEKSEFVNNENIVEICKRNKGIATRAIKLVARRAYEDKRVEYFLIRISSRNPHSKHVFEKMGVILLRTTESTFRTFMKDFKDVMKNTEVDDAMEERLKKIFDNADELEEEVVYEYKLTSEMFL